MLHNDATGCGVCATSLSREPAKGKRVVECGCRALMASRCCRMCGYGECEPRTDVEYGIQSSLRLRAAVA